MGKDYDDGLDLSGIDDELDLSEIDDGLDLSGIDDSPEEEQESDTSMLESGVKGAVQGASLGFGEELGAAALSLPKMAMSKISEMIPGSPEHTDALLREQGFTGDIEQEGLLDTYRSLRDTTRESNKEAQEANPVSYGAGEFAGAVAPTLAMGGSNLAAGGGASLGRLALQGGLEGAVAGSGYSEADLTKGEVGQFAEDTAMGGAIGAVGGAVLPAVGKGVAKKAKDLAGFTGKQLSKLPFADSVKTGYKLGKKGIELESKSIKEEIKKFSSGILKDIKKEFKKTGIVKTGATEDLHELGIRINAGEPIQNMIDEILETGADTLDQKVELQKVVNMLEGFKKKGNPLSKAIKRNEKKVAKQALKMEREGAKLETTTAFDSPIEDVIPLPESRGTVRGVESKYKMPDGSTKKSIVTDFDELVNGPIVDLKQKDLEKLTLVEIDNLMKLAGENVGEFGVPKTKVNEAYKKLYAKLKEARNKAIDGDSRIIESSSKQSSMYGALEDAGLKGKKSKMAWGDMEGKDMRDKVGTFIEGESSLKKSLDHDRFFDRLEEANPDFKKQRADRELLSKGWSLAGNASEGSTSVRSSLGPVQGVIANVANVAGSASRSISKSTPVEFTKKIMKMPKETLTKLSQRSPAVAKFSNIIQKMVDDPSKSDVIMWTLSRQPGFRKAIQDALQSEEDNERSE